MPVSLMRGSNDKNDVLRMISTETAITIRAHCRRVCRINAGIQHVQMKKNQISTNGDIRPLPSPTPLTDCHQLFILNCDANVPIPSGVSSSHMCEVAHPLFTRLFFQIICLVAYSQVIRADFDAQYVKRRSFAQVQAYVFSRLDKKI